MAARHKSDIIFGFAIAVLLILAFELREVLLLIYVSALFAVVTSPFVERVQRLHFGRRHLGKGIALVLMLRGVFIATLFSWFVLPPISTTSATGQRFPG